MYALLPSTLMNFMEKAETTEGQIKDAAEKQAQAAEASEAVKTGGISKDSAAAGVEKLKGAVMADVKDGHASNPRRMCPVYTLYARVHGVSVCYVVLCL